MRRHIVPLPALLVEPQPPPAPLLEVVLPPHPQDRGTPARRSDFPPRDCRSCRGPSRRPPPREPRRRARHLPSTASAAEGCRRLRDERGPRDGGWWTHGLPPKVGNRDRRRRSAPRRDRRQAGLSTPGGEPSTCGKCQRFATAASYRKRQEADGCEEEAWPAEVARILTRLRSQTQVHLWLVPGRPRPPPSRPRGLRTKRVRR